MKSIAKLTLAVLLTSASVAMANDAHHVSAAASSEASVPMSEGEVKKVDKETGKITIKHGPLANLDMPPMTMVFHVKDAAMLDNVKPGDKISFIAEKSGGKLTVTRLEAKK